MVTALGSAVLVLDWELTVKVGKAQAMDSGRKRVPGCVQWSANELIAVLCKGFSFFRRRDERSHGAGALGLDSLCDYQWFGPQDRRIDGHDQRSPSRICTPSAEHVTKGSAFSSLHDSLL